MKFFSSFINLFRSVSMYSCFGLLMATSTSYGFVFKLDQWKRGNQNIYCLSNSSISNKYSQKQLDEMAQFAIRHDARIIVADMLDYSGKNSRIKKYVHQWEKTIKKEQFLLGSVHHLQKKGIQKEKISNIEFRHAAITAIDGAITLNTNDVMKPAYNEYHKAWKYRDEKVFDAYYKSVLNNYREFVLKPCRALFFYMYWRSGKPLAQVLSKASYYKELDPVVALFDGNVHQIDNNKKLTLIIKNHGNPLISIKIAHAIAQAHEKNVIVCAEPDQILEINTLLDNAGFQCAQSKLGTVRIGPKNSNVPRALTLHKILNQRDHTINTKTTTNLSKQLSNCSVSKTREDTQKKDAAQDMNRYIFFAILLLGFFLVAIFRYQYT